jgi:ABC-type arginine transport system permease subunit
MEGFAGSPAALIVCAISASQVMFSRILATSLGILIGLIGLTIDFIEIVPPALVASATNPVARSLPDALVWFWTYFTHLSNLGLVLVYVAVLTGWRRLDWFANVRTQAAIGGYILLVMLYYHSCLRRSTASRAPCWCRRSRCTT